MKPRTQVKTDIGKRTVWVTMSGIYDEAAMREACALIHQGTEKFHGQDHIYLADMRGMKPSHPSVAAILGDEIGWTRKHGVVMCAHVSDDTVQRLQALRVARGATPGDDVTVDCGSLDEAERVLNECRDKLLQGGRMPSASQLATSARNSL